MKDLIGMEGSINEVNYMEPTDETLRELTGEIKKLNEAFVVYRAWYIDGKNKDPLESLYDDRCMLCKKYENYGRMDECMGCSRGSFARMGTEQRDNFALDDAKAREAVIARQEKREHDRTKKLS